MAGPSAPSLDLPSAPHVSRDYPLDAFVYEHRASAPSEGALVLSGAQPAAEQVAAPASRGPSRARFAPDCPADPRIATVEAHAHTSGDRHTPHRGAAGVRRGRGHRGEAN
jgi:hypothetical protein